MKNIIINLVNKQRHKWREDRFNLFLKIANVKEGATILDLGGHDGSFFYNYKDKIAHLNLKIIIADIDEKALEIAKNRGFETLLLNKDEGIPLGDNSIDIVFCNSVIEHITVPESEVWTCRDEKLFKEISYTNQKNFANEIMRVGKGYFIQTPHAHFIIETHSWLPFSAFLNRKHFIQLLNFTNKFWIIPSTPNYNLLHEKQMADLFPNASNIYVKKALGFKKEIIAAKI